MNEISPSVKRARAAELLEVLPDQHLDAVVHAMLAFERGEPIEPYELPGMTAKQRAEALLFLIRTSIGFVPSNREERIVDAIARGIDAAVKYAPVPNLPEIATADD